MEKKKVYHIIEWLIALAACGWLVWKMATYDDYAGLWATLQGMNGWQWGALVACVALMPVNMAIEAWRWKTLVPMPWHDAHIQVYYSKLAGLITPWRLGEYPARALLQGEWKQTLSMGVVGSATMTAAIVIAGIVGLGSLGGLDILDGLGYYLLIGGVLLLLGVGLYFAPSLLKRWTIVSHKLVAISLAQSLVRLLCWCVQLGLVLWALDPVVIPLYRDTVIPKFFIYYLLVTVTPNVPVAEVGVRGAWAIIVFGTMNAAFAGVLLWGVNTLLPCLLWPFLRKKCKINTEYLHN